MKDILEDLLGPRGLPAGVFHLVQAQMTDLGSHGWPLFPRLEPPREAKE